MALVVIVVIVAGVAGVAGGGAVGAKVFRKAVLVEPAGVRDPGDEVAGRRWPHRDHGDCAGLAACHLRWSPLQVASAMVATD